MVSVNNLRLDMVIEPSARLLQRLYLDLDFGQITNEDPVRPKAGIAA